MAYCLMIQGTGSHVGKSVLATGLGRVFYQDGYRVAPFKSQNMTSNSYVTLDGGEMSRAQATQAEACGLEPSVLMNPVLIKPSSDIEARVILLGKPASRYCAGDYFPKRTEIVWPAITHAFDTLASQFEIIVLEGAGSPAEVNLRDYDLANMRMALYARAPVILVADIDRGGALAAVVGTLELLRPKERNTVRGIIINKFRGDRTLLQPALDFLEQRTGIPVLGVVPYFDLPLPEEDVLGLEDFREPGPGPLDLVVLNYPRISNFTDLEAFLLEPDVRLRWTNKKEELGKPDAVILPGSNNTTGDLALVVRSGLAERIKRLAARGVPVVGLGEGIQIMGQEILDSESPEAPHKPVFGLGLLDLRTKPEAQKTAMRAEATISGAHNTWLADLNGTLVYGYEIRHGPSFSLSPSTRAFMYNQDGHPIGFYRDNCWGTYLHGVFDNDAFRHRFLNELRVKKGLLPLEDRPASPKRAREAAYDQLAQIIRQSVNVSRIYELMGVSSRKRSQEG